MKLLLRRYNRSRSLKRFDLLSANKGRDAQEVNIDLTRCYEIVFQGKSKGYDGDERLSRIEQMISEVSTSLTAASTKEATMEDVTMDEKLGTDTMQSNVKRAQLDAATNDVCTPAHLAAQHGHTETLAQLLLDKDSQATTPSEHLTGATDGGLFGAISRPVQGQDPTVNAVSCPPQGSPMA